jgi:hypothetical protein
MEALLLRLHASLLEKVLVRVSNKSLRLTPALIFAFYLVMWSLYAFYLVMWSLYTFHYKAIYFDILIRVELIPESSFLSSELWPKLTSFFYKVTQPQIFLYTNVKCISTCPITPNFCWVNLFTLLKRQQGTGILDHLIAQNWNPARCVHFT